MKHPDLYGSWIERRSIRPPPGSYIRPVNSISSRLNFQHPANVRKQCSSALGPPAFIPGAGGSSCIVKPCRILADELALTLIRVITVEPYLGAPSSVISHSSPFGDAADVSDHIGRKKPGICATVPWIPWGRSVQDGINEKAVNGDIRACITELRLNRRANADLTKAPRKARF